MTTAPENNGVKTSLSLCILAVISVGYQTHYCVIAVQGVQCGRMCGIAAGAKDYTPVQVCGKL